DAGECAVPPAAGEFTIGVFGAWLTTALKPVVQFQPLPVIVLAGVPPVLSATVLPVPSFKPQRPSRFGSAAISSDIVLWICACVRATFQIRTSSITPLKNPAATPVDVRALPIDACWMLSKRGVNAPFACERFSAPSRYSCQAVPSYTPATWCHAPSAAIAVPPAAVTGWLRPVAVSSKSA